MEVRGVYRRSTDPEANQKDAEARNIFADGTGARRRGGWLGRSKEGLWMQAEGSDFGILRLHAQ